MVLREDPSAVDQPVIVSLDDLVKGATPLSILDAAFGPSSLGIIIVKDLPSRFVELRHKVLSYSSYLGNLPVEQLEKLESKTAKYLTGWSLGKESLKSNQPDTLKGSYYINCAFYQDSKLQAAPVESPRLPDGTVKSYDNFTEHTVPNVWPEDDLLPGFRTACEELSNLIIDVASLVARACDTFAEQNVEHYQSGYLEKMVKTSMTTKARLLHYFPIRSEPNENEREDASKDEDDWCATHVDHGCLTGLTSAMYIDEAANPPIIDSAFGGQGNAWLPSLRELDAAPDPEAGLYVHSRTSSVTKINIPRDCLAFQTGEALELITKGRFRAVPHFVKGALSKYTTGSSRIARNTLAVFTQPNLWELVDCERGADFGDFSREVASRHY